MSIKGMTRRGLCATGGALVLASVAAPAMGQTRYAYGPFARQSLIMLGGRGSGPQPLVLMLGRAERGAPDSRMMASARRLNARGITVALVDRRAGRHGFNAHTSDVATALGWLMERREALALDGRIALWGEESGATAALLLGRDRRYLSRIGLNPRDLWGMVLLDEDQARDATLTHPSAYGAGDPAAVFRGTAPQVREAEAFISGLL